MTTGRVNSLLLTSGGSLPASVGGMDALTSLQSSTDAALLGTIPESLGSLTNLQWLRFGGSYYYASQLSGSLPASLSALTALRVMDLSGNQLSGTLPPDFFAGMSHLVSVDLHGGNNFTGSLPPSLLSLPRIMHVDIGQNSFTGLLPATNAPNLRYLNFRDNSFSGPLSGAFLAGVTGLKGLYLDNNQLSGELPDLSVLTALTSTLPPSQFVTDVVVINPAFPQSSTNLSFSVNAFLKDNPNIYSGAVFTPFLDLSRNLFTGAVNVSKLPYGGLPSTIFKGTDLSNNQLSFAGRYSCSAVDSESSYMYLNAALHPQAGFGVVGDTVLVSDVNRLADALSLYSLGLIRPCNRGITTIVLNASLYLPGAFVIGGDPYASAPRGLNSVTFSYGPYGKGYTSYVSGYPMQAVWHDSVLASDGSTMCTESTSQSVTASDPRCLLSASRSVTIVGACSPGPCVLDVHGAGRHFEVYASGLRLQNLMLVNGASPVDGSGNYLQHQIAAGNYLPQPLWGGGSIFADPSSIVEVENCTFSSNTATQPGGGAIASLAMNPLSVRVVNSVFKSNSADGEGGAIYTRGGAQLVNSMFQNNNASSGGAVAAVMGVNVTGCTFEGNVASAAGGGAVAVPPVAATYTGLPYYRPRIIDRWLPPRVQPDCTLSTSNFTANQALLAGSGDGIGSQGKGGALLMPTGTLASLFSCQFSSNLAQLAGGAIYGDGFTDTGSYFGDNNVQTSLPDACSAYGGGAIALSGFRGMALRGTQFSANTGGTQGGAILASYQVPRGQQNWTSVMIQDAYFAGNMASNGGAILLRNVKATLTSITCADNSASPLGGMGGCLNAVQLGGLLITGGSFRNNTADYGGAASISCGLACTGSVLGCSSTARATGTVFSGNAAGTQGGAVYMRGGGLAVQGAMFSANTVSGVVAQGGALFVAPFFMNGVEVPMDQPTGSVISDTILVGNQAQLLSATLLPTELYNEAVAAGFGGALLLLSSVQSIPWLVTNTTFIRNSALSGGAAYVYGKVNAALSGVVFADNTAANSGGALLLAAAGPDLRANLSAVNFSGNTAATAGGALALSPGTTLVATSGCVFVNNTAVDGAVISLGVAGVSGTVPAPSASLRDATATRNTATRAGGLFYTDASNASAAPLATCSGACVGNHAPNSADVYAAVPVSHICSLPAVTAAVSGQLLPPFAITVNDGLGNQVMAAPDLTVTVTANDTTALSGAATVVYANGAATFNLLTLTAAPGTVFQLTWVLSSASLSLVNKQVGSALAVMEPCRAPTVFDSASLTCVCAIGYFLNASAMPPTCNLCPPGSYTAQPGQMTCILNPPGLVSLPHTTFSSSLVLAGVAVASFGVVQNATLANSISASLNVADANVAVSFVADVTTPSSRRLTAAALQANFTVTATGTSSASAVAAAFNSTAAFTRSMAAYMAASNDPVLSAVLASSLSVTPPTISTIYAGAETCPAGTRLNASAAACVPCPFGQVATATDCIACTPRTVWVNSSSPCVPCPDNAVSSPNTPAVCACAPGFYDSLFGASATSPACEPCPPGGVCTSGFLAASAGWWRESTRSAVVYKCLEGNCLQENVTGPLTPLAADTEFGVVRAFSNVTAPTNCVPGNTGPLCSLCLDGYALQSGQCLPCPPHAAFDVWSPGAKTALVVVTTCVGLVFIAFAFFQPLSPRLQRTWTRFVDVATDAAHAAAKQGSALRARCLRHFNPNGAVVAEQGKAANREVSPKKRNSAPDEVAAEDTAPGAAMASLAAEPVQREIASQAASFLNELISDDDDDVDDSSEFDVDGETGATLDLLDKLQHMADTAQKYAKILINFYQIVSTFIKTLDIPWPHVFTATMGKISVINLNLVRLPKAACMNPKPGYYNEFNGYTLGLLFALLAMVLMWGFGRYLVARVSLRGMDARETEERLRKFSSTCLQRMLMLLYLVYPGVSVAIFGMFSCTTIGAHSWLNLDMNIPCYDRTWWRYCGGAIIWLVLVPVGVPLFFNFLLRRYRVPDMAALVIDNAWLREAAEHTWRLGMPQPVCDVRRICCDTIEDNHLAMLHAVLLKGADANAAADILAGKAASELDVLASPEAAISSPVGLKDAAPLVSQPASAPPAGLVASIMSVKRRIAAFLRPELPPASPAHGVGDRSVLLAQLMRWCRHAGVLSAGQISWSDDLGLPDAPGYDKPLYPPHVRGIRSHEVPELLKRASVECGFLFSAYTTRCWYWESVELLRKLILTSILALISPGSAGQVVVGCLVAFLALLGNLKLRPYAENALNFVNQIAQTNLFFVLFVALLLKVDLDGDNTAGYFTGIVGCLTLVPIVCPFTLSVYLHFGGFRTDEFRGAKGLIEDAKFET
jgi:predicted outer membrane repeat protein